MQGDAKGIADVGVSDDKLKLDWATHGQQEKILDDWLARHPAGP